MSQWSLEYLMTGWPYLLVAVLNGFFAVYNLLIALKVSGWKTAVGFSLATLNGVSMWFAFQEWIKA